MGNSASASSLPYSIQEELCDAKREGSYGWALHAGARKSDGTKVSVFKASKQALLHMPLANASMGSGMYGGTVNRGKGKGVDPNSLFLPACHYFSKVKTLVHPHLIKVFATLDTDKPADATGGDASLIESQSSSSASASNVATTGDLIIVTEEVQPLEHWLDSLDLSSDSVGRNSERLAWGLYCVVQALHFLHSNAKLAHAAVSPPSVFVTPAGDFKLANFSLLTHVGSDNIPNWSDTLEYFRRYESSLCPSLYRSPERINAEYDLLLRTLPPHVMDAFSLGVFIEFLYSRGTNDGMVPDKLRKAVARLKSASATQRPRVGPLSKCPVFDNPLIKSMEFLDEIAVKPAEEKVAYFLSLPDQLQRNVITKEAARHKLLPALVMSLAAITNNPHAMMQDVLRREVMAVVPPLFHAAELLDDVTFQNQISPVIAKLFQLNDRGVRGALLSRLPSVVPRLDKASINSCVFEPMCTGFTDSSGALRELTLKSTLPLIPSLNHSNLEKLTRYLVRLQGDPEASIRTNTVIFITKIAPSLTDTSRSKLILPAFVRAMKDPFTPCRLAALKSIMQCRDYFDPPSIATKVLPSVVPHLMDGMAAVRNEAFSVLEQFAVVLKEESRKMEEKEVEREQNHQHEQQNQTSSSAPSSGGIPAAPSSGGASSSSYISSFTSWAANSITSQATKVAAAPSMTAQSAAPQEQPYTQSQHFLEQQQQQQQQQHLNNASSGCDATPKVSSAHTPQTDDFGSGWSDDDKEFNSELTESKAPHSDNGVTANGRTGGFGDDFDKSFFSSAAATNSKSPASPPSWATSKSTGGSSSNSSMGIGLGGSKGKVSTTTTTTKLPNVDDFFSTSMVGGVGGIKIGSHTSGVGSAGKRLTTPTSTSGRLMSTSSGKTSGSKLVVPNKKKQTMAERKAEYARRKAEREQKQQHGGSTTTIGARKLDGSPSAGGSGGWDDF